MCQVGNIFRPAECTIFVGSIAQLLGPLQFYGRIFHSFRTYIGSHKLWSLDASAVTLPQPQDNQLNWILTLVPRSPPSQHFLAQITTWHDTFAVGIFMVMDPPYVQPMPDGQVRDLATSPYIGDQVISAGLAVTILAISVLGLRLFTRAYVVRSLGVDDYFAVAAGVASIIYCSTVLNAVHMGAGQHMYYMLISTYSPNFLVGNIVITVSYSTSVAFSKLSILIFYLRLSPKRSFRISVYTLIAILSAYTIAYQFVIIFQCNPVQAAWDITVKGECMNLMVPMMTLSIANIVIDTIVLLIPVKVFLELQMSTKQRASLIGLFGAGGFVCAVAIQRTVILPGLLASTDYTWDVVPQMIWGYMEVNTGLICAALPALKPLFTRYLPRLLSTRSHNSDTPFSANSTVVAFNRRRRELRAATGDPELHNKWHGHESHQPCGPSVKLGRDDEENLWSPPAKAGGASGIKAYTSDRLGDDISLDSLEEAYGCSSPTTRTVISSDLAQAVSSGNSDRTDGCGEERGRDDVIMVTRETRVGVAQI